jgi:DNA gyrase subunit A
MDNKSIGKLQPVEITQEMRKSYLDYAMSVIVARALPDVKDGLKPVHRRILYAMHQMGLSHSSRYAKSAKVVGETMGKYHPHGDMAIYDALVRLAQDFSMRYPLIDGQGNFGSIDGDSAAAMRYTEVRLKKITQEMITDIDKETVEFRDNFDGSLKEPVFLPSKIPNLLLMGSDGIAVGMATKIPPHNLNEIIDATVFMIEKGKVVNNNNGNNKYEDSQGKKGKKKVFEIKKISLDENQDEKALLTSFESDISIEEDLMKFIKGPDFPTGAAIYNKKDILQAYATGNGKIIVRAKAEIEEAKGEKFRIAITEIPYQVNKANLVAKIAQLVKERKIDGVTDLRDESDRQGMRIVVELKKTAKPKTILNNLYKHTQMQTSYPVNIVALVDGVPMVLNLKQILTEFIKHRQKVVTKRTIFELEEAKKQAHILEGLKIAVDNIDAVISTIKKSKDALQAKNNLMKKFKLTEIQAEAILEMQLRRLAALERKKIEDDYKEIMKKIGYLTDLLTTPKKILDLIKKELLEIKKKYGDSRRTKVYTQPLGEFNEEDLVPQENCLVTLTKGGYIKRLPVGTYRSQKRGGKGVTGMTTKAEDEVYNLFSAKTHDTILFFTNQGRVFAIRVWEIPEGSRQAKGQAIINLINISQEEKIQAVLPLSLAENQNKNQFLIMVTRKGVIKKTRLKAFANIRSSGLIAIKLNKGDELCWIKITEEGDHVLLVSHQGKSIRFKEKDVRPTGRDTMGVRGIRLKKDDYVMGMEVFPPKLKEPKDKRRKVFRDVLVVMEHGLGKRTSLKEHRLQKRGGIGIRAAHVTAKTGNIVACRIINEKVVQIILTSRKAQVIKLPVKNVPRIGRDTQGVIFMRFNKPGDSVAAVTCLE